MSSSALRVSYNFLSGPSALFQENNRVARSPVESVLHNPWYIVAAVAFNASNRPEGVLNVFERVRSDLRSAGEGAAHLSGYGKEAAAYYVDAVAAEKMLAQRMSEALFKSGLTSGYPKAINSLKTLHDALPAHLRDTRVSRDTTTSLAEYEAAGARLFNTFYGDQAAGVQDLLDSIYPDMGWFSRTIGYGLVYGHHARLSPRETAYTLIAALIPSDTPQQTGWHLASAQRAGAPPDEVRAVREAAMRVASLAGVRWRHGVPEVREV